MGQVTAHHVISSAICSAVKVQESHRAGAGLMHARCLRAVILLVCLLCSYVSLRLLGEGPDVPAVVQARNWVSPHNKLALVYIAAYSAKKAAGTTRCSCNMLHGAASLASNSAHQPLLCLLLLLWCVTHRVLHRYTAGAVPRTSPPGASSGWQCWECTAGTARTRCLQRCGCCPTTAGPASATSTQAASGATAGW